MFQPETFHEAERLNLQRVSLSCPMLPLNTNESRQETQRKRTCMRKQHGTRVAPLGVEFDDEINLLVVHDDGKTLAVAERDHFRALAADSAGPHVAIAAWVPDISRSRGHIANSLASSVNG